MHDFKTEISCFVYSSLASTRTAMLPSSIFIKQNKINKINKINKKSNYLIITNNLYI